MALLPAPRLVGLDLARLVALLGMVVAHLLAGVVDGQVTWTHQLVAGRSSGLFALLAGVAIVLLARTREPVHGAAWRAEQAASAARAAGLGVLGLLLGGLVDTGMSVILAYYAVLFVLATPFLALRTHWIAVWAGVVLVVGPPLSQVVRSVAPRDAASDPTLLSLLSPLRLLEELLLTGSFPALTWLPFVLAGMVVGRLDLRSEVVTRRLTAAGAALVLLAWAASDLLLAVPGVRDQLERSVARPGGPADLELILGRGFKAVLPTDTWAWLLVRAPHSGAWLDQVNVIGSSCLVIGVCLALGRRVPERFVAWTGAGSLTLTLYTLHVVSRDRGLVPVDAPDQLVPQVVTMLALGALAHRLGRRGPLETVLTRMSSAARAGAVGGHVGGQPEPSLR